MSGSPCLLVATSKSLPEDRAISPTEPQERRWSPGYPHRVCLNEEKRATGQIEGLYGVSQSGFQWIFPLTVESEDVPHAGMSAEHAVRGVWRAPLRATAATNALDHEADIAKVQEWLGRHKAPPSNGVCCVNSPTTPRNTLWSADFRATSIPPL